jgi:ketosteroid isomerase-like protein
MKTVLLVALIASLTGPLLLDAQDNASTAKEAAFAAAVESIMEKWSTSLLASDSDAWISLWDDDSVKLPINSRMIVGIENIKGGIEGELGFAIEKYEVVDIEITATHVDNNLGYAYGIFRTVHVVRPGVKIDRFGKYVTIFKKQDDGSWKIVLDCSNLNY